MKVWDRLSFAENGIHQTQSARVEYNLDWSGLLGNSTAVQLIEPERYYRQREVFAVVSKVSCGHGK